jgi:surface antigen
MWIKRYWKLVLSAFFFSVFLLSVSSYFFGLPIPLRTPGTVIDEFNGVEVHYNGSFSHVNSRNLSETGYNIGLKWQCVEFIKRYYLEIYNHEMPNSYGNAVDFFDTNLKDGELNTERDLVQFSNPSCSAPRPGEIVIFKDGYGHVAIISKVSDTFIEVIQQNVGLTSRENFDYKLKNGLFLIKDKRVLGRLRKDSSR